MRKSYIVEKALLLKVLALLYILLAGACKQEKAAHGTEGHSNVDAVKIDSNLSHLLKPSNEQVISELPVIKAEYGTKIFTEDVQGVIGYDTRNENNISSRVSGRIERLLVKYNYQPVSKGQLIMEVYSPDLAAAQQELLFLKKNETDQNLLAGAKQRLMLLGMSASSINQLLKTERVNYRIPVYSNADGYILEKSAGSIAVAAPVPAASPSSGSAGMNNMGGGGATANAAMPASGSASVNSPVMLREGQYVSAGQSVFMVYNADHVIAEFSLKPALAALIKRGSKFVFYKTADKSTIQNASIGMIQPVFKDGVNFTIARVYLLNKPGFKIGELLTAKIPVLLTKSWWLPEAALVTLGNKKIVFKKEGNVFIPKPVNTSIAIAGMVQIATDIGNWEVGNNAAYLVDSESFIEMPK